jgi:hypothetical protein
MPSHRRTVRLYAGLGLAVLLLLAFLGGMLAERLRYDRERTAVLERLDGARRAYQQRLIESHRPGDAAPVQAGQPGRERP